jgi:hypothetical protein
MNRAEKPLAPFQINRREDAPRDREGGRLWQGGAIELVARFVEIGFDRPVGDASDRRRLVVRFAASDP